jgi:hypothetical protein
MEEEQSGLNWPFVRLCAAALAFLVFYEVVQWKQRRRQGASAHARGSGAAVAATLAASEFRRVCATSVLEPPADIEILHDAVRALVHDHCARHGFPRVRASAFLGALFAEVAEQLPRGAGFGGAGRGARGVSRAAEFMWTSARRIGGEGERGAAVSGGGRGAAAGAGAEFCAVLNEALDSDRAAVMNEAATVVLSLRLMGTKDPRKQPTPEGGVCWRGAGLPAEHVAFFEERCASGGAYRVRRFLATSFRRDVAAWFQHRGSSSGGGGGGDGAGSVGQERQPQMQGVLWRIKIGAAAQGVDGRWREGKRAAVPVPCTLNYLDNQGEDEYLFAPYSAFRVTHVLPLGADGCREIWLQAEPAVAAGSCDGDLAAAELPLAPWH